MATPQLDDFDRQLIEVLGRDARVSNRKIAADLGVTEGTVRGGAYMRAIHALKPDAHIVQRACPLFVALAEEGWTTGPVPEQAAEHYLREIFSGALKPDTLVLGCTHFPVLTAPITKAIGAQIKLVDSAATTAVEVERRLDERHYGPSRAMRVSRTSPRPRCPSRIVTAADGSIGASSGPEDAHQRRPQAPQRRHGIPHLQRAHRYREQSAARAAHDACKQAVMRSALPGTFRCG